VTRTAVYLYPWDVEGDSGAAARLAALGVGEVALAAAYHDVRAVTPHHPGHRIVTRRAGVYYNHHPERWRGSPLRPAPAQDVGSFERAASRLRGAGLTVTAWLVITHNETLAAAHPQCAVRNAFGDPYPWALCLASPGVREYAAMLAAEVAALECVDGIELEACGWFGYDHLSAHDKTGGRGGWPLDVCLCPTCCDAFSGAGLGDVGATLRHAIDSGAPVPSSVADAVSEVRAALAGDFLRSVISSARAAAPGTEVLVQADPDRRKCGANPGHDPAVLGLADGVVLNGPADLLGAMPGCAPRRALSVQAVTALSDRAGRLAAETAAAVAAGATDLRFYHAGLASSDDLAAIREVVRSL
jgi:hypothetical protein